MNVPADCRPNVGIIGVGAMGMAMALNLRRRGWQVRTRDLRADADEEAHRHGLHVCHSPRALAEEVDIAVVVVVNALEIEAVLFGADGVASTGAGAKTVMLCSTIAPQDTRRFASRLATCGIATIDAPISGGPARALAGTMSMMLAAPAASLAPWQALFADLADRRFVVGETIGDAAKAKLVNNLLAGINLVGGAEALSLAAKIGLDPRAMFEVIRASSGSSWVFEDRMARALAEDYRPPRAAAHILTKDVGLATALAASVEHATPLGDAALARLRETVARGWAEFDDAAVIKTYQATAATSAPEGGDAPAPADRPAIAFGYRPGVIGRVAEMQPASMPARSASVKSSRVRWRRGWPNSRLGSNTRAMVSGPRCTQVGSSGRSRSTAKASAPASPICAGSSSTTAFALPG